MSGVTLELGEFLSSITVDDLPERVRHLVGRHFLDCLGVAVAGGASEPGRLAARSLHELDETPHATVLSSGQRASVSGAAWANGVAAHALDFDDTGFSHPTACILPAVLAVGERRRVDGSALVAAMVAGYEAFERIASTSRAHEPGMRARGFHPTALYGCAAAAAGAAHLMGLDGERTATAIGLALTNAGGLNAQIGTWGKGVHAGNAARAGVVAAHLASQGYWSSVDILEAEYGFFNAYFGRGSVDLSNVLVERGTRWAIEEPGLNIKPYPACGRTLRAIDASLRLRELHGIDPARIRSVVVDTFPDYIHTLPYCAPTFGFHGKFSLDFCVAVSLLDGRVDLESFSDESANRTELRRIIASVEVNVREDWGPDRRRENPVTVILDDGSTFSETVNRPRGSVANPLTDEELADKFRYCAGVAGLGAPDAALVMLQDLLSVADVGELVRAVVVEEPRS